MPRDPVPAIPVPPGNYLPPFDPGVPGRWMAEAHRGEATVVHQAPPIVHNGQPLTGVPPTPVVVFI